MEETIKKIESAEEALQMTVKSAISIENVKEQIYYQASTGLKSLQVYGYVSDETKKEIMDMGFMIGIHKDPINGNEILIIKW